LNHGTAFCHISDVVSHEKFMEQALDQARIAERIGETPVGAVVVSNGKVIGRGHNRVETDKDPTAHAEMIAVRQASAELGDWRLLESTLYVTLEPCIMCASALIIGRLPRIVFGARDIRWGGFGSLFDFSNDPRIGFYPEIIPGVLGKEASKLLRNFFKILR
jgi:tRNA(adenine34) deaminase